MSTNESDRSAERPSPVPREALYLAATPLAIAIAWVVLGSIGINARFILMNATVILPLSTYVLVGNRDFRLTWALIISVASYIIMETVTTLYAAPGIFAVDAVACGALMAFVFAGGVSYFVARRIKRGSSRA